MLSLVIIIPTHQRQNKNKTWHLKNLVTFVNIYIIICYMNIGEFGVARCQFNNWVVNGYGPCAGRGSKVVNGGDSCFFLELGFTRPFHMKFPTQRSVIRLLIH